MSTAQKCERCREYNAAAVDFRNQAANAQSDLAALLARHNALVEAVRPVVTACFAADADGELDERIDGEMLFKLAALVGEEGK